jgi:hypothetical protein
MTQQFDAASKKGGRAWIVCSRFGRGWSNNDSAKALVRQRKARHKSCRARANNNRVNAPIDAHGLFHSKEDGMSARFSSRCANSGGWPPCNSDAVGRREKQERIRGSG